jgi:Adenylate and Guanylate cyclase catalytic domain/Double zinc ribbon
MKLLRCQHENPLGSAFCEECGACLEQRCPSCGSTCAPAAKFCRCCGTALVADSVRPAGDAGARKVVTIVFADLIGSTGLHERLDAESVRSLMGRYYGALHAAVEAHGATVVKLLGDGVMAAFGLPRVAEDDAIRAVRAALAMQQAFRALAREQRGIGLRVAVNTGEVVVDADTDDASSRSCSAVEPIRSAKTTVTTSRASRPSARRPRPSTPLGTGSGRAARVAPQALQKREPGGLSAPQPAQRGASRAPQALQKRDVSGFA